MAPGGMSLALSRDDAETTTKKEGEGNRNMHARLTSIGENKNVSREGVTNPRHLRGADPVGEDGL